MREKKNLRLAHQTSIFSSFLNSLEWNIESSVMVLDRSSVHGTVTEVDDKDFTLFSLDGRNFRHTSIRNSLSKLSLSC